MKVILCVHRRFLSLPGRGGRFQVSRRRQANTVAQALTLLAFWRFAWFFAQKRLSYRIAISFAENP
jgi:hypothetical protein